MAAVISITNLITSILPFAHFSIYRSVALLALASGYLFMAMIVIANALTIPWRYSRRRSLMSPVCKLRRGFLASGTHRFQRGTAGLCVAE